MVQGVRSFSDLLEIIKPLGLWQWSCYALLGFTLIWPAAINVARIFVAYRQPHHCALDSVVKSDNQLSQDDVKKLALPLDYTEKDYDSCHVYNLTGYSNIYSKKDFNISAFDKSGLEKVACDHWTYDNSTMKTTIVSDFDLVCGNEDYTWIGQTGFWVSVAGTLTGSIIIGSAADLIGRARSFCLSGVIILVFGIALAFARSYPVFFALQFFVRLGSRFVTVTGFVLAIELTSARHRTWVAACYFLPHCIGYWILALLAYLIRDWRILQIVLAVPNVVFIPYFWLLSESPRWLLASGKVDQAMVVIEKAARMNKAKLPPDLDYEGISHNLAKERSKGLIRGCANECCSLIRIPLYVVRLLIVTFNWFVIYTVLYGLLWNANELHKNIFINMVLLGLLELPSVLVSFLLLKWGRRTGLIAAQIVVGLFFLVTLAVPSSLSNLKLALFWIARCIGESTISMIHCYTTELFPTVVRTTILSIISMAGTMGFIAGPYIHMLPYYLEKGFDYDRFLWVPPVIFGVSSVLAAMTVFLLPETKCLYMPDHIEGGLQNRSWFEKKIFGRASTTSGDTTFEDTRI